MQIGDDITLHAHVLHVERNARCGHGINADGVIHKVGGKRTVGDLILRKVTSQLMQNGRDHFQVRQFLGTYLTSVIVYDIIRVTTY